MHHSGKEACELGAQADPGRGHLAVPKPCLLGYPRSGEGYPRPINVPIYSSHEPLMSDQGHGFDTDSGTDSPTTSTRSSLASPVLPRALVRVLAGAAPPRTRMGSAPVGGGSGSSGAVGCDGWPAVPRARRSSAALLNPLHGLMDFEGEQRCHV